MNRMVNASMLSLVFFAAPLAMAQGGANPIGETAHFDIDTDADRTSGLVTGGTVDGSITQHNDDTGDGPNYTMALNYVFDTSFGQHSGQELFGVPDAFFTPEFMPALRASGHYQDNLLTIDYLGTEDATTMDGHSYPGCDRIKISNIKQQDSLAAGLKNMVVVADIYPGVPVISAVKLDVSGKYSGLNIKVGGDYQTPKD